LTPTVLFGGAPDLKAEWIAELTRAFIQAELPARIVGETDNPSGIDYILYSPGSPIEDFSVFSGLKAVLSLWAGVEELVANPSIKVPVTKMVDHNLTQGMIEYVVGHTLRYHLDIDRHLFGQDGRWRQASSLPPLARERTVGILGLGSLGSACARALVALGFRVLGWSRSPKSIAGVDADFGTDGLHRVLRRAEILILLLPHTTATHNLMGEQEFALMPEGSRLINAGRGQLVDDKALLGALDDGRLAHATADVFREEPLPPDHRFWQHPAITVTPHIAADTRPESASRVIAENIRRAEAGLPLANQVSLDRAY